MSKKSAESPAATAAELRDLIANLSAEERAKLEAEGNVLARYAPEGTDPGAYGYRCQNCNKVVIRFAGNAWLDAGGNQCSQPPLNVPLDQIPWSFCAGTMRRMAGGPIHCPRCGGGLRFMDGMCLEPRDVVHVETWEKARNASLEACKRREYLKPPPDSGPIPQEVSRGMRASYDFGNEQLKQDMEQRSPGITAKLDQTRDTIQQLDDKVNVTGALLKGLGAPR